MRRTLSVALVSGLLLFGAIAGCRKDRANETSEPTSSTPEAAPRMAPDFTLPDLDGQMVSLSDFAGKGIILDFWATWCPPCVEEIPHFVELYEANKDKGFVIIGIVVEDTPEAVREFVEKQKVTYPILLGDNDAVAKVAQAYGGVQYLPTTFLIRYDGRIVERFVGYQEKETFESLLPEILPPPSPLRERANAAENPNRS